MKCLCYFNWTPEMRSQAEAIRRFKEFGGRPPAGVRIVARWIQADFMGGVVVLECDDARSLTEFSLTWSDVMNLKIVPVVEDQELVEVLARVGK